MSTAVHDVRGPLASAQTVPLRSRLTSAATLALIGLTLLAALIRFWHIGHQGFWFDEGSTALLVQFSPRKMLAALPYRESSPPLYYCVAWIWGHLFGDGEVALRSLSAVFGVCTVPIAYAAGAKLISRRAGLIACALTASSPLLIWYSQEARAYGMLVLLSSAALLAFAYVLDGPTPRTLAAWAIVSALALGTHYYAVLAIAPQALWLLARAPRNRGIHIAVGAVGACGLALVPLAAAQAGRGLTSWIGNAALGRRLAEVWPQYVLGFGSPAWDVLKWLALAAAVVGLVLLLTRSAPAQQRAGVLAAGLVLAGLALNLLVVAAGIDDLITRNLLALWMPAALAVAAGLAAPRARAAGLTATVVLCVSGIVAAAGVATNRDIERPDWRGVARLLGPGPDGRSGTSRAIFIQHYRNLLPLSLYESRVQPLKHGSASLSELDIVSFTSPPSDDFCWWGAACNLWPSRAQPSYSIPGFHEAWRRRALQFTVVRLVSSHPVKLTPHEVARALTTTRYVNDELLIQR